MSSFPWLTTLIVLPLVGAVVLWALPPTARAAARQVALAFALVELVLTGVAIGAFDTGNAGTYQLAETHSWIPAFGVSYAVAVNGLGLVLVAMSALLVPLVVLAAWREQGSEKAATDRLRAETEDLVHSVQDFKIAERGGAASDVERKASRRGVVALKNIAGAGKGGAVRRQAPDVEEGAWLDF